MNTSCLNTGSLALPARSILNSQPSATVARDCLLARGASPGGNGCLLLVVAVAMLLVRGAFAGAAPLQYNGDFLGGRLIYDPNSDLTWYQPPATNVIWNDAMLWAPALDIGGVNGWRLPSILPATVVDNGGMAVSGHFDDGELAYLWYDDLGNHLNAMTNSGPFEPTSFNSTTNNNYWVWTISGPWYGHLATWAVAFDLAHGIYGVDDIDGNQVVCLEMAVCPGNVAPSGRLSEPITPQMAITLSGTNVIVSWPSVPSGWQLLQCDNPSAGDWSACGGTIENDGTNCCVTISPATGNLFYRLTK